MDLENICIVYLFTFGKKKYFYVFFVLYRYHVETCVRRLKMSGRSKFGVGGANLEWVEQIWPEQCGE